MIITATEEDFRRSDEWARAVAAHYHGQSNWQGNPRDDVPEFHALSKVAECVICRALGTAPAFPVGMSDGGVDGTFEDLKGRTVTFDVKSTRRHDATELIVPPKRSKLADMLIMTKVGMLSNPRDVIVVGFCYRATFNKFKQYANHNDPVFRPGTRHMSSKRLTPFPVLLSALRRCAKCHGRPAPYGVDDQWYCRDCRP